MSTLHSALLRQLVARGYLHQATDLEALDRLAAEGPITAYIGFDCTADSLHVGNLVGIMLLRRLQQTGHRPIALIGGGTSKIGDPSGMWAVTTTPARPDRVGAVSSQVVASTPTASDVSTPIALIAVARSAAASSGLP
jgi:tyrosyl-tRNA synthetase